MGHQSGIIGQPSGPVGDGSVGVVVVVVVSGQMSLQIGSHVSSSIGGHVTSGQVIGGGQVTSVLVVEGGVVVVVVVVDVVVVG